MSRENIIVGLEKAQILSTTNIAKLRAQENNKHFLVTLVEIYEKNTKNYLMGCAGKVKKLFPDKTNQPIIDYAYAALLKTDKSSVFLSLAFLLKETAADLASAVGVDGSETVFLTYVSRYLIFTQAGGFDLRQICIDVEADAPELFPRYLFDAFLLQSKLDENPKLIFECLRAQVFYVGTAHLQSREEKLGFASALAQGYLEKNKEIVLAVVDKHLSSDISSICAPTLAFIGIHSKSKFSEVVQTRLQELSTALTHVEESKAVIDQEADRLKGEVDKQTEQIRNRPTIWKVGFGPEMGSFNGQIRINF